MRAAEPGRDLLAQAKCYRLTPSIGFVRAWAFEDDPADPVAAAQSASTSSFLQVTSIVRVCEPEARQQLAMLAGNGLGQLFLWPGQAAFDGIAQSVFLSLVGCFSMLFTDSFMQARRHLHWDSRCLMLFYSF